MNYEIVIVVVTIIIIAIISIVVLKKEKYTTQPTQTQVLQTQPLQTEPPAPVFNFVYPTNNIVYSSGSTELPVYTLDQCREIFSNYISIFNEYSNQSDYWQGEQNTNLTQSMNPLPSLKSFSTSDTVYNFLNNMWNSNLSNFNYNRILADLNFMSAYIAITYGPDIGISSDSSMQSMIQTLHDGFPSDPWVIPIIT